MKISKTSEFNYTDMLEAIKMLGFEHLEMNFFRRVEEIDLDSNLVLYCEIYDDCAKVDVYEDATQIDSQSFKRPIKLIDYIENLLKSYDIESIKLVPREDDNSTSVFGATTRDFAKKLLRVKSSNVWSYAFQPKTEQIGDLLMQFKGDNGGPGDIYIYYDVPSKIWRKLVAAPSKGAFFWRYIRNVAKYAKLTGDRRTKLPNGI